MTLPKSFTTVTPLSKTLAAILFVVLPFFGFYLGIQYQKGVSPNQEQIKVQTRIAPSTSLQPTITEGSFCGGIAGKECPLGYTCQITDRYPDAGGKCVSAEYNTKPTCTPHVPIGSTGSIPPNDIYPTLPPGGRWCPDGFNEAPPKSWDDSVCTGEAKLCPDGSSVGRQGPNCEFKKCPGE